MKACAQMNEQIFKNYLQVEKGILQGLIDMATTEVQKKEEKELTLKQFVEEADDISILEISDSSKNTEVSDVC